MNNINKNDFELLKKKYKNMGPIIKKINKGYPIQYLIGFVNFYGYDIKVSPKVLIPRYETEFLVEKTLNYIHKMNLEDGKVLDIGTGSGCISITLKKEIPSLKVDAIDKSFCALILAKKNAKNNLVNISFKRRNLFKFKTDIKYDVIISNPPYIPLGSNVSENIKYEPKSAIFVKGNPLKYYETIFKLSNSILKPKSLIALEIDEDSYDSLDSLVKIYFPNSKFSFEKDLTGKWRYLFIIND